MRINLLKDLKIGFSLFGLIILVILLLPNIIWAVYPPATDVLVTNSSAVPFLEYGENISRIAVFVLLVLLTNKTNHALIPRNIWTVLCFIAFAIYWCCWVLYYTGQQGNTIIYAMVIFPVVGFVFAGIAEKVYPISIAGLVFFVFHLFITLENFPII